ncbi:MULTISPECIES: AAA family ATPase [Nonomuraea]|uniref:AAA family ATPase n=2 Tax=Nonomuraea TaxID=83681 RepID=A0ABW4SW21_9ACTN
MAVLRDAIAQLRAGTGGVVLVDGEPGIGKSSLVAAAARSRAVARPAPDGRQQEQSAAFRRTGLELIDDLLVGLAEHADIAPRSMTPPGAW